MSELPSTIAKLQSSLAKGELSVPEALQIQRQRLSSLDGAKSGFVQVFDPSEDKYPTAGSLSGIGLAHKDIFQLTHRAPGLGLVQSRPPGISPLPLADCIEALHRSGAVQLGALHMAPYACGATSQNEYIGECINPLDANRVVGGSSSGSAVAVAQELCYASLGTDTAGSIRIPAATCGLVGLKTTMGLLPTKGVAPLAPHLDTVGLIARSAEDLELVLRELHANTPHETPSMSGPLRVAQTFSRIHCWLPTRLLDARVAQEMLDCANTLPQVSIQEQFEEETALSACAEMLLYQQVAQSHCALKDLQPSQHQEASLFPPTSQSASLPKALQELMLLGCVQPRSWSLEVLKQRSNWTQRFLERYLTSHDLFMLPSIGIELPLQSQVRVGDPAFEPRKLLALHRFMAFVNYLGLPSLSLPIGADSQGMPISVQVICRPYQELSLLRWAQSFIGARFGSQNVRQLFPILS